MNSKITWRLLMAGALGLWVISLVAGYLLFPESHLKAWGFFFCLLVIHTAELPVSLRIRNKNNPSIQIVIMKTLLYGFTWWVPVKRGIIDP
ncbi:MAG: hypothetical protein ABIK68_02380 [bacterium]